MSYLEQLEKEVNDNFEKLYLERFVVQLFNKLVDIEISEINHLPRYGWGVSNDDYYTVLTRYVSSKLLAHKIKRSLEIDDYITEYSCTIYPPNSWLPYEAQKEKTKNFRTRLRKIKEQQYLK